MRIFPIFKTTVAYCLPVMLLACSLSGMAGEFVITVSLQADASFAGPFEDIKWNDKITETLNTSLRYRIEDHGTWFKSEADPFQVDSSRSVSGGGEYDDGAFGQCTWKYLEHNTTEGQVRGATGGLNVDMTPGDTSSYCGVSVIWPGIAVEDTDCPGTFMMFGGGVEGYVRDLMFTFEVPAKNEAWNFTRAFSTNGVDSLGVNYSVSCSVTVQLIPEDISPLKIVSVVTPAETSGRHSFVASDLITLRAKINPPKSGVTVKWTVEGLEAAAGIKGFPKDQETATDGQGSATFTFTPADNLEFVQNRRTAWTNGSVEPNSPIGFEVVAVVDVPSPPQVATLSNAGLGKLLQDDVDILRQEFFDYRGVVPPRSEITESLGGNYNRGNYTVQRNYQLKERYEKIVQAYRGSPITIDGQTVAIPQDAIVTLGVGGGFRCPRRNVKAGSIYPVSSFHTRGRALDLGPRVFAVTLNGARRVLTQAELHSQLYPALKRAAATQGSAITEDGAQPVPPGCCGCIISVKDKKGNTVDKSFCEDHVHVQWE